MNISFWKDDEVKKLFDFVEKGKENNNKMSKIFNDFSIVSGRKPNSIRNYYYLELSYYEKNNDRLKNLNIDVNKHIVKKTKKFSDIETEKLISEIVRLKNLGYSVRSACLKLADGDLDTMVRLQNKYRVMKSKQPKVIEIKRNELKQKGFVVNNESNIIKMPTKPTLSDNDITSLFMGLVKLVKKTATENANKNLIKDAEFANDSLRKALVNLSQKESEIKKIRKQFKILEKENQTLKGELFDLKCKELNKSTKSVNKLKDFVDNLKDKNSKVAD